MNKSKRNSFFLLIFFLNCGSLEYAKIVNNITSHRESLTKELKTHVKHLKKTIACFFKKRGCTPEEKRAIYNIARILIAIITPFSIYPTYSFKLPEGTTIETGWLVYYAKTSIDDAEKKLKELQHAPGLVDWNIRDIDGRHLLFTTIQHYELYPTKDALDFIKAYIPYIDLEEELYPGSGITLKTYMLNQNYRPELKSVIKKAIQ